MRRLIAYIDGFNLYFGLNARGWKRYYWLDLWGLGERLRQAEQRLVELHYYTARISNHCSDSPDARRQTNYLEALESCSGLHIHEGTT